MKNAARLLADRSLHKPAAFMAAFRTIFAELAEHPKLAVQLYMRGQLLDDLDTIERGSQPAGVAQAGLRNSVSEGAKTMESGDDIFSKLLA